MYREELRRWERMRILRVKRKKNGSMMAFWDPPMPKPEWGRLASSREVGIFLPVDSVESFFDEYKKQTRDLMRKGLLPSDTVCPPSSLRLPLSL